MKTTASTIFLIICLTFFGLSCALLTTSFLSYETVRSLIVPLFPAHCEAYFTEPIFDGVSTRVRFASMGIFLLFMLILAKRRRLINYLELLLSSFRDSIRRCLSKSMDRGERIHIAALFGIVLISIVARWSILLQPMRYDEAVTFLRFGSKPLYFGLSNYFSANNHLFHTFLLHIAYRLFGDSLWAIRLPAFIAGILLVPACYILFRSLYNKYTGLICAALIGSSSILISYSANARGYTLFCLIFVIILTLAVRLKNSTNAAGWLLFSIFTALGFYTMPVMLYPFGVVAVWMLLSILYENGGNRKGLIIKNFFVSIAHAVLFTFILYFPVLVTACFVNIKKEPGFMARPLLIALYKYPAHILFVWRYWTRDLPLLFSYICLGGFIASIVFHRRLTRHKVPVILAVPIWLIPTFIIYRVFPYTRTYSWLLILYIGMASAGLSLLFTAISNLRGMKRVSKDIIIGISVILLTALLSLTTVRLQPHYWSTAPGTSRGAEEVVLLLKDRLRPDDKVITIVPSDRILEYYFIRHNVPVGYLSKKLDLNSKGRIFVACNQHYTLEDVLNEVGYSDMEKISSKKICQYESTTLYQIEER